MKDNYVDEDGIVHYFVSDALPHKTIRVNPTKCRQCGATENLVPYGEHFEIRDFKGRIDWQFICKEGYGCQAPYEGSWSGWLTITVPLVDGSFIVFGMLILSIMNWVVNSVSGGLDTSSLKWIFIWMFAALPFLAGLFMGFPIIVGPVVIVLLSWWWFF